MKSGQWPQVACLMALAPAKTPRSVVDRLHGEIVKLLAVPAARERLNAQGFEPVGDTPEEFAAYIKAEIPKWAAVVKASGAQVE